MIDKGSSSISSDSSSKDSLLADLKKEEEDEEYEEKFLQKSIRKSSKENKEEEEKKSSEMAPEVLSLSSDESDSSILNKGRLALKNLTTNSSKSGNDDWEPSASRAVCLAMKPKRALCIQIRTSATVTHISTTTITTTVLPPLLHQNYTKTAPITTTSTASPPPPTVPTASSENIEEEEERRDIEPSQLSEEPELSNVEEESPEEPKVIPLWWILY